MTNKDQVCITEISHVQKMHFFIFSFSFHLSCSFETLSRQNAHEKSKPILPIDGKFNADAENGVVFEF